MAVLGRTSQLLTHCVEKKKTVTLVNYFCRWKQIQTQVVNARLNIAMSGFSGGLFFVFFFPAVPYFYLLLRSPLSHFCPVG